MVLKMSTASGAMPARTARVTSESFGGEPKGFLRRLAALAIVVIVATQILGCAADPEVVRENRRALERPGAFVN